MQEVAHALRLLIERATPRLQALGSEEVARKPRPEKWSKKEILGHLIDSAGNNHQRFVRAHADGAADFPTYEQNAWVAAQQYHRSSWPLLVDLWRSYNLHLADVIERLPVAVRAHHCNFGTARPVTLEFAVTDYLRHLRHHLKQILPSP